MLEFDELKHEYRLDGKKLPSVTQILSPLFADVSMNANQLARDSAARRGSRIHEVTADFDIGLDITDELDAEIAPYISAYIQFSRDYDYKPMFIELPCTNGQFAGTIDRVATVDGKLTVIDLKTGTSVNTRAVAAQTYAYSKMCASIGMQIEQLMVLHLKKDGKYSARELDPGKGEMFWNACWGLYELVENDKRRNKNG